MVKVETASVHVDTFGDYLQYRTCTDGVTLDRYDCMFSVLCKMGEAGWRYVGSHPSQKELFFQREAPQDLSCVG